MRRALVEEGLDAALYPKRPPPRLPTNVGHYEDTFRKVEGSWLLATRRTFLPFGGETERLGHPRQP